MLLQRAMLMMMATSTNPFGAPKDDPGGGGGEQAENEDVFEVDVPTEEADSKYRVAEDDYAAQLVDLFKDVSSSGNSMYVWEFELLYPRSVKGKTFRNFTALTPAAMWKLTEVLEALDLGKAGQKAKFSKKDAIGRYAIVTMEDEEYKGQMRSSIRKVSPMSQAQREKLEQLKSEPKAPGDDIPF